MQAFSDWLLNLVHHLGYLGIFVATMIESTFVPIPAEMTMIPAGMLAASGQMNYWGILASAVAGVIAGSAFNYWLGYTFGHALLLRYGKYVGLSARAMHKTEYFFRRYGAFAVFTGRLLPGVRHYIAFIAGVARMPWRTFIIYTGIGGLIWMWALLQVGYMAGINKSHGHEEASGLELIIVLCVLLSVAVYAIQRWMMRHHKHPDDIKPSE